MLFRSGDDRLPGANVGVNGHGVELAAFDPSELGGDLRGEISRVVLASAIKGWGVEELRAAIDEELKEAAEREEQVAAAIS